MSFYWISCPFPVANPMNASDIQNALIRENALEITNILRDGCLYCVVENRI